MQSFRRQLTLFLPEHEKHQVDAIRQWLDPRQHQIIAAHVTLCRETEIENWAKVHAALKTASIDVSLTFGKPIRLEDGCIMLPVSGATESYDALRRTLLGNSCKSHAPHITLLHPRHAQDRNDDLEMIARAITLSTMRFTEACVIEQVNGGVWKTVDVFGVSNVDNVGSG